MTIMAILENTREVMSSSENDYTEITLKMPNHLIDKVETLAKEWKLSSNGEAINKLLEEVLYAE
tara:strand:- start:181 stop:372 length:192 start_codon:yes stop_codon:yes gene_type:complete